MTTPVRVVRRTLSAWMAAGIVGMALFAAPAFAEFGIVPGSFSTSVSTTQAGAHPDANTAFAFNLLSPFETDGNARDIDVDLPPGFTGNPQATPQCTQAQFASFLCPTESQVGIAVVTLFFPQQEPVYNVKPPNGQIAEFGFKVFTQNATVIAKVRTDTDSGLTTVTTNIPSNPALKAVSLTLWGVPASPIHDALRYRPGESIGAPGDASGNPISVAGLPMAFLTNLTTCTGPEPLATLRVDSWQNPDVSVSSTATSPISTGCDQLTFSPSFSLTPDTAQSEAPAGYSAHLGIPQSSDPNKLGTPPLRDATVTLPAGVTLSPGVADGLQGCTDQQFGLHTLAPATCPEAAKIGTVHVATPVLPSEESDFLPNGFSGTHYQLSGSIYVRKPDAGADLNSMYGIFLDIEDPTTGLVVKLRGSVVPNPATGQLTAVFTENPQLPFSDLLLEFEGGPRAPLANPVNCGTYTTNTSLSYWSGSADATPSSSFGVDSGPGGGPCPAPESSARPFNLGFDAGVTNPVAGANSPFVLHLSRPDGAQEVGSLNATLPPGFAAVLKGVPDCSEAAIAAARANPSGVAEQGSASCPVASQIGTLTAGVGAGSNPLYVGGKAYLAGPYKGAPLSAVFIVPAVTGPFDLGNVVVRAGLYVDPNTAQVTVRSDRLPTILQGVPLRIRSIAVNIDRPSFTLNPTSCEKFSVGATVAGSSGASANLSSPFQVGNCSALAFKPKLKLSLSGGTSRAKFPALKAVLTQPAGQANIGYVQAMLPHSEFLEQGHIGTVCTRVQFNAVPRACPAQSVYGKAKAWSPLLEAPLEGPVYLRANGGERELPDLVAALKGPESQPIEIDLVGYIDAKHGRIRNTFALVPDAPVSRFVLEMEGGKKGLLTNSENLCKISKAKREATVRVIGQNNMRADQFPVVQNQCKAAGSKGGKKKSSKRVGGSHR